MLNLRRARLTKSINDADLIYGLSAYNGKIGLLKDIKKNVGGKGHLLSDILKKLDKDLLNDFRRNFWEVSDYIPDATKKGILKGTIHFNMQYIKRIAIFLKKCPINIVNSVTSKELRWIKENWKGM